MRGVFSSSKSVNSSFSPAAGDAAAWLSMDLCRDASPSAEVVVTVAAAPTLLPACEEAAAGVDADGGAAAAVDGTNDDGEDLLTLVGVLAISVKKSKNISATADHPGTTPCDKLTLNQIASQLLQGLNMKVNSGDEAQV